MSLTIQSGTLSISSYQVHRLGYDAMQLADSGVFGPPKDRDVALAMLREAVSLGANHIGTNDFYGPYITNQLTRGALHSCHDDLLTITKIGAGRNAESAQLSTFPTQTLTETTHDNLRNLGLDMPDVVNLRIMFGLHGPAEGLIETPFTVLAGPQRQGLVRHTGLSNVTVSQIAEGWHIREIVCVQNHYNLVHRNDDGLIDTFAHDGIAYVPYFPLGGFNPLQSPMLDDVTVRLGTTPMQTTLVWLLQRSPNVLLTPDTSSAGHLCENLGAAAIALPEDAMRELDAATLSTDAAS